MTERGKRAAVVTGAATGIGLACARRLLGKGFDVVACGRRADVVDATVHELEGAAGAIVGIRADMGTTTDPERALATCVERFGRIDASSTMPTSTRRSPSSRRPRPGTRC